MKSGAPTIASTVLIAAFVLLSQSADAAKRTVVNSMTESQCTESGGTITGPGPLGELWCCYKQSDGGVDCDHIDGTPDPSAQRMPSAKPTMQMTPMGQPKRKHQMITPRARS